MIVRKYINRGTRGTRGRVKVEQNQKPETQRQSEKAKSSVRNPKAEIQSQGRISLLTNLGPGAESKNTDTDRDRSSHR